ncbi:MAG: Rrf2 family transcriptional regulator [Planctomycetota bacterium]
MMISLTGEYALRAMIFLAEHADACPIPGSRIAESAGVPRKYLSTILGDLVRSGILEGTRGRSGGFQIARPTKEIRLFDVVAPFEPIHANRRACPFGNKICSEHDPCAAHEKWKEVNAALTRFLEETTLQDFALKRARAGNGNLKA